MGILLQYVSVDCGSRGYIGTPILTKKTTNVSPTNQGYTCITTGSFFIIRLFRVEKSFNLLLLNASFGLENMSVIMGTHCHGD